MCACMLQKSLPTCIPWPGECPITGEHFLFIWCKHTLFIRLLCLQSLSCLIFSSHARYFFSEVDLLLSQDELRMHFPRVTNASYEEYILGPGEMLFVPRWWWHFIVAVDRDSALLWRATHLPGQHCKKTDLKDENSSTAKRCVSPTSSKSSKEREVKRPRVALVLPPPLNKLTETQSEGDVLGSEDNEIAATPLQDDANVQSGEGKNSVDYSFSVSFWWGKRILKS